MSYFIEDSEPPSYVVSYGLVTGILNISFRKPTNCEQVVSDIIEAIRCLEVDFPISEVIKVNYDKGFPRPPGSLLLPREVENALRQILLDKHAAVAIYNPDLCKYVVCLTKDDHTYPIGQYID